MDDFDFNNKTALVRLDFNSPVDPKNKKLLDDTRIQLHGENTVKELIMKGAKIVILAHQGRPGKIDFITLEQHAERLEKILHRPVKYIDDLYGDKAKEAILMLKKGEVIVLKNTRTFAEEQKVKIPEEHAKSEFVKALSPLVDVFINDAFSTAHRSHTSIVGFSNVLPNIAGRIMERELEALNKVLDNPLKPCVFVLGGAKVDDSLEISKHILKNNIADYVLTGGITGHLFLVSQGVDLGKTSMSFLEGQEGLNLVPGIKDLFCNYAGKIKVPLDVAYELNGKRTEISSKKLPIEKAIYDIGSETIRSYAKKLKNAKTIVVSGPPGVYEKKEFMKGTKGILEAIANSKAFSLAGGGHTLAALRQLEITDKISYASTAGGALIEFLMGKK